jgi:hypothetical protein
MIKVKEKRLKHIAVLNIAAARKNNIWFIKMALL